MRPVARIWKQLPKVAVDAVDNIGDVLASWLAWIVRHAKQCNPGGEIKFMQLTNQLVEHLQLLEGNVRVSKITVSLFEFNSMKSFVNQRDVLLEHFQTTGVHKFSVNIFSDNVNMINMETVRVMYIIEH
jgi:hypothetical protein